MARKKLGSSGNVYEVKGRTGFVIRWKNFEGRLVSRLVKVPTIKEARASLAEEKAKVEKARTYGAPLPSEDTFAKYAGEFLEMQKKHISPHVVRGMLSKAEYVRQQGIIEKQLKPWFGTTKLAMIRKADVTKYIHDRTGQVAPGTIIKEVNVLKRMLNVAVDLDKITKNPAQRIKLPQAPEGRARYLTPEELKSVLACCRIAPDDFGKEREQWLQQAAALAVSLGLRRGELMSITPRDVDLDARHVKVRRTKNGRPRTVFINDLAMTVFESMGIRERQAALSLFAEVTPEQVSMRFIRACRAAGIEDFSFHDLRHTFASHLKMNGADGFDLMRLLGHSDMRMVSRYVHLSADHLRSAASKLDGVLSLPSAEETAHEIATAQARKDANRG